MNNRDIFGIDKIGKFVKYKSKDFGINGKLIYGRYYGRGYEGNSSIYEPDYNVITFITPHGLIINVENDVPELVEDELEIVKILNLEKKIRNPYSPFFSIKRDGSITRCNNFSKLHLKLNHHSNKWFKDNGYLTIDSKLFGNNLAQVFSALLHEKYYFNDITSKVIYTNVPWSSENYRRFMVISKNKYRNYQFNIDTIYPFKKRDSKETPFTNNPIKLDNDDFLIYFGNTYDKNISLGDIKYGKYIPNNYNPFNSNLYTGEIIYNNIKINFIEIFMKEIIKYKFKTKKAILSQEDMDIILKEFTFIKKDKMQVLVDLLKQIEIDATNELLKNNTIGKTLKLTKKQH